MGQIETQWDCMTPSILLFYLTVPLIHQKSVKLRSGLQTMANMVRSSELTHNFYFLGYKKML